MREMLHPLFGILVFPAVYNLSFFQISGPLFLCLLRIRLPSVTAFRSMYISMHWIRNRENNWETLLLFIGLNEKKICTVSDDRVKELFCVKYHRISSRTLKLTYFFQIRGSETNFMCEQVAISQKQDSKSEPKYLSLESLEAVK